MIAGGRKIRPTPGNAGPITLRERRRRAKQIVRRAEARTRAIEQKNRTLEKLLPNGFTPAPNAAILPAIIQERIRLAPQDILDSITPQDTFIPTPAQCQMVYDFAMYGVSDTDIRQRLINPVSGLPISTPALYKHFRNELATGRVDGNIHIAKSAYRMSVFRDAEYDVNGKLISPEKEPNPSVLIAQGKYRLGWTDRKDVTVTHNNGVDAATAEALKQLTPDELRILRTIASRRAAEKAGSGPEGNR